MPQILIPPENLTGQTFSIYGSEAHHLIRVLRKKVNDPVKFFDGQGRQYEGRLTYIDTKKNTAGGEILRQLRSEKKGVQINLFQGIPKGSKMDFVVEKATELGADWIVPFFSQKNPLKMSKDQVAEKGRRWERLIVAASKQSQRGRLPRLEPAGNLIEFQRTLENGLTLVFDLDPALPSLKTTLRDKRNAERSINVVIGPESGFSPEELDWLKKRGAKFTKMGHQVLRTETAGLVALAAIKFENDSL